MIRLLLVTNGHGEGAIAARLARELRALGAETVHFPLVGAGSADPAFPATGPRAAMPSGGLVAMGNLGALLRDVQAGFAGLLARQAGFLRSEGAGFSGVVAVGDVYGLSMALLTGRPVSFVGTAKSVYVAPYGPGERTILRRARLVFVRDEATARELRRLGVSAESPGNLIADLAAGDEPASLASDWIGLMPGSRREAYLDTVRLGAVLRGAGELRALVSVAPGLDPAVAARLLAEDGWAITWTAEGSPSSSLTPFSGRSRSARIVAWRGSLGSLLRSSRFALGQAGTANELAAAMGVPVAALGRGDGRREDWYRMRQRKLLGDALALIPCEPVDGARALRGLLDDPVRLARMAEAGRERMGPPGGAAAIAARIAGLRAAA